MKAGAALVPVMAVCSSKGGQGNACNQTVCSLDTLGLHLGEQSPMIVEALVVIPNTETKNLYVTLVIQTIVLPFMNRIQRVIFQQVNARPLSTLVTQRDVESVDLLLVS
ncbi:phospholipid-transporting ATPase [Trichonephila clavipes]|nr:phospholipid-transporting ATPase [Trichonephila clavipes]